jgi:outer membrane protein OmpA-like peptidoglycan-associated protein
MQRVFALSMALGLLAGCSTFMHEAPAKYLVFFSASDTNLSPDARAVVDHAAAAIRGTHPDSVMIAAGIATGDNLKLAQPRFDAVRAALVADGVSDDLIARSAIADASLSVGATGDQRVEIKLVTKPAT